MLFNMSNRGHDGRANRKKRKKLNSNPTVGLAFTENKTLPASNPEDHYQMSHETRHRIQLSTWLGDNEDDPALTVGL